MQIILNGNIHTIQERTTVHELVNELGCADTNFAIAVNAKVVPPGCYPETWLMDNDQVEIVTAIQGG